MLRQIFGLFLILSICLFAYVKYFERKGIYYPTKTIQRTPAHIGLEYEDIFFDTADGIKLNAWFIPAENSRGTLLFCHGNAGNIGHRCEIIKIFHQLRLTVFIFDYRGYGRSQGRPNEAGLYQDARSALQYLVDKKGIAADTIIIYGKSIGANVAIELAAKVKAQALISESGFTSAAEMGRKLFPYLPVKWLISVKYDALSKIRDIAIPKLIIHSRDDEIIPFSQGERLFQAAPGPKEFYQMRGGHNDALFLAKEEFTVRLDTFLNKYIRKGN